MIRDLPSKNEGQVRRSQAGSFLVSTIDREATFVADMDAFVGTMQKLIGDGRRFDLGSPGRFETMVFRCDEDGEPVDFTERDARRYSSRDDAWKGHQELCVKWDAVQEP